MREAQRSYEANLNIISATRRVIQNARSTFSEASNKDDRNWLHRQLPQTPTPRFRA